MRCEWESSKIGDLGKIITGKTPPTKNQDLWDGNIPFITPRDLQNGKTVLCTERTITSNGIKVMQSVKLPPKSVCVSCIGNIGYVAMTCSECISNQQINSIIVNSNNDADFVYYLMKSLHSTFKNYEGQSTTLSILNKKHFSDIDICIPPLDIQKQIAAILSALDEKIATNRAINDNLERQAQVIYHERFETVSPNDLPSDWRIVTLGEVATISNKSFNPLKEPEMLLEHYSIPAFDEARFPVFDLSTSIKSNKFIIDASCFMISKLNPTTKRVWKPYCLTGNAVCSTEFIVYKAKDKTITDFLYSVIDSNSFSDFMCSHVTGSTGSRQRTTPSDTLSYELILPSEDELAEFQSLVSPMYAQIRINAIENDRLKRLRDSLLPKLMSAEIDVSDIPL